MGRRLRWWAPGVRYYEVVTKCCGDEMLMRPDAWSVFITALALAIACAAFPRVHVVSVCFLSNHMHLVLYVATDEDARSISDFMQRLDQLIAQDLNKHRERNGHFFRGPPRITAILDDAHLADRMTYTHAQPVHHGLVERVEDWPGLSSFRAVCEGKPSFEASYLNEEEWREAGAVQGDIASFTQTVSVPLTMPASWSEGSEAQLREARAAHERSVRERERQEATDRAARGERRRLPKGSSYTRTDPFSRPTGPTKKTGPQPWAHGDADAETAFRAAYSVMLEAYRVASARFRSTGVLGVFPTGTFPPWVREVPPH